jgi:hypothetical protein
VLVRGSTSVNFSGMPTVETNEKPRPMGIKAGQVSFDIR